MYEGNAWVLVRMWRIGAKVVMRDILMPIQIGYNKSHLVEQISPEHG